MDPDDVRRLWEELNKHQLGPDSARRWMERPQVPELAAFSAVALREAGQRVLQRDGQLLLTAWQSQVRADVYGGTGRAGPAIRQTLERNAERLRSEPTPAETHLWEALLKRVAGHAFKRQVPKHGYILDFYCPAAKLAVELDGSSHREVARHDQRRDEILLANRILTLRFRNDQVWNDLGGVVATIEEQVKVRAQARRKPTASSRPPQQTAVEPPATKPASTSARGRSKPERVVIPPVRRAFWCSPCGRTFVAAVSPQPICRTHPGTPVKRLCVNRDKRFATVGDLCKTCAQVRGVALGAADSKEPFGQRRHRTRKIF